MMSANHYRICGAKIPRRQEVGRHKEHGLEAHSGFGPMREFPMMDRMTRRDDYWSERRVCGAGSHPEGPVRELPLRRPIPCRDVLRRGYAAGALPVAACNHRTFCLPNTRDSCSDYLRMTGPERSRSLRTCSDYLRRACNYRLLLTLAANADRPGSCAISGSSRTGWTPGTSRPTACANCAMTWSQRSGRVAWSRSAARSVRARR